MIANLLNFPAELVVILLVLFLMILATSFRAALVFAALGIAALFFTPHKTGKDFQNPPKYHLRNFYR